MLHFCIFTVLKNGATVSSFFPGSRKKLPASESWQKSEHIFNFVSNKCKTYQMFRKQKNVVSSVLVNFLLAKFDFRQRNTFYPTNKNILFFYCFSNCFFDFFYLSISWDIFIAMQSLNRKTKWTPSMIIRFNYVDSLIFSH
jgi:hypothetical protein